MVDRLGLHYPPNLHPQQAEHLLSTVKDWSIVHGVAVRPSSGLIGKNLDHDGALAMTAPITLFPSLFPQACFEEAREIQRAFNELYSAIVIDEEWLAKIIKEIIEVDDFIAKLWEIHQAVKKHGYVQDLSLGLFRSDYMIHLDTTSQTPKLELKQVEFNTIASSFGGLSAKVSSMHQYLLSTSTYPMSLLLKEKSIPPNPVLGDLTAGLAAAHEAYGASKSIQAIPTCILFIVQELEHNVFDQRLLEYCLQEVHHITIFRLPFSQVLNTTQITKSESRILTYHPPHAPDSSFEVTVLYYRTGYSPTDYPSESAWAARLHLERSAAIKCPSILTHLAGSKKIQQVLATPSSLELDRFIQADPAMVQRVRNTFTNIYPLDDSPTGQEARRLALDPDSASRFVLKPQREGGGNNIYRSAIPPFLRSLPETHWKGYILMEIIEPPVLRNIILRNGKVQSGEVVSELGVYGVVLFRERTGTDGGQAEMLYNSDAGYLLRTKGRESQEGGVAAGFGCIDSCLLVDV